MDLQKYFTDFEEASKKNDPMIMMQAMQEFFGKIYQTEDRHLLLGLYSTAQQLEKLGLDSRVIKLAIKSHVGGKYASYPSTWKQIANSLNLLLRADGLGII